MAKNKLIKQSPAYVILIGADHRQLGKSTLAAKLASKATTAGWTVYAVKIRGLSSPQTASVLSFEDKREKKASVHALFQAGCQEVLHIMAREKRRLPLFNDALHALGLTYPVLPSDDKNAKRALLICESNALRLDLVPDLFIHIDGDGKKIKPTAKATRDDADVRLHFPYTDSDVENISKTFLPRIEP